MIIPAIESETTTILETLDRRIRAHLTKMGKYPQKLALTAEQYEAFRAELLSLNLFEMSSHPDQSDWYYGIPLEVVEVLD